MSIVMNVMKLIKNEYAAKVATKERGENEL